MAKRTFYKTVLHNFTAKYDPNFVYTIGQYVEVPGALRSDKQCAPGIHVSKTYDQPISYIANLWNPGSLSSARLLELEVDENDILFEQSGDEKVRVRKAFVVREVPYTEVIPNFDQLTKALDDEYLYVKTSTTEQCKEILVDTLTELQNAGQVVPPLDRVREIMVTQYDVRSGVIREGYVPESPTTITLSSAIGTTLNRYLANKGILKNQKRYQYLKAVAAGGVSLFPKYDVFLRSDFILHGIIDGTAYVTLSK